MNYLVFLKLGGISNACGNDLPDERPSPLKTVGQPRAVIVAIRHLGPALLGTTLMLVRIRWEGSVRSLLDLAIGESQPMFYCRCQRHTQPAHPGEGLASRASRVKSARLSSAACLPRRRRRLMEEL